MKRGRVIDVLVRDGQTVMLIEGHVVQLSEVGAAIFDLAEDWVDLEILGAALVERFGRPDRGSVVSSTKDAVTDLVRHSVLVSSD